LAFEISFNKKPIRAVQFEQDEFYCITINPFGTTFVNSLGHVSLWSRKG